MLLSVVAGRSHSGFRAAVYGIHFDPWGFDTLLYFVKMVAVFCFNGCREFAFFVYAKELPAEDCPTLTFFPLRGSILRLRRAPSLRGYSLRTISLSLSHRYDGLGSSNRKRSWMIFSMYCPTFLRLCSMSRFEKRMTRMSYFSMRLLRFSSYFIPSKERFCAPSTSMTNRAFLQKKSTM